MGLVGDSCPSTSRSLWTHGVGRMSWQSRKDSQPAVKGQLEHIKALVIMSFPFP